MTASQLIRLAALRTGRIEMREKVIEYADPPLEDVKDRVCWLCGGETDGKGLPVKKAIKSKFTDHPFARAQGSSSVCSGCVFCLSARELRNYSILATDKLFHPMRAEWRQILVSPPVPPFVMCLAVSGQKHLTFKAPVNLERERYVVMLEERPVGVVPYELEQLVVLVEALYAWFTKDEILTGRYGQHRIKECGLARWEQLERQAGAWRGRVLFELALFVAQKWEEVEGGGLAQRADGGEKGDDKGPVQATAEWA